MEDEEARTRTRIDSIQIFFAKCMQRDDDQDPFMAFYGVEAKSSQIFLPFRSTSFFFFSLPFRFLSSVLSAFFFLAFFLLSSLVGFQFSLFVRLILIPM